MNKLNKHLTLLILRIKAAFIALPQIMAGMIVFSALMVIMAIALVTVSSNVDEEMTLMKVGVVYPQSEESKGENQYIEQAFAMLGKLDAVKEACTFESFYSEEEALSLMKDGELSAIVILPEKFISSIIYGENKPARIVFPTSNVNTSSMIFREILASAASDLSSAQAGIYAVDDAMDKLEGSESDAQKANTNLNLKYVAYALDREAYYETVDVSGGAGSTTVQFYVATGMVMLFLMGGITCVELLKSESKVLGASLRRFGVTPGANYIYRVFSVTVVFWVIFGIVYTLLSLTVVRFPVMAQGISSVGYIKETIINADGTKELVVCYSDTAFANVFAAVMALFVLFMAVFAMAGLIFKIAGKTVSGVILLFLLSVVMMFASGCFLPVSMLPPVVGEIGAYLPTSFFFELCMQIITGSVSVVTVAANMVYGVVFLSIAAFMENRV